MAEPKKPSSPDGNRSQQMTRQPVRRPLAGYAAPLNRLRSEFDRLFDEFFQGGWPAMWRGERETGWQLDVQERDDQIVVRADAPGFEPDDFDLQVQGDNLVLRACQSSESKEEEEAGYQWQNRQLYHSIPLPSGIDADKIDAQYHNGVLTMRLPKTEQARGRKIEIKG